MKINTRVIALEKAVGLFSLPAFVLQATPTNIVALADMFAKFLEDDVAKEATEKQAESVEVIHCGEPVCTT